MLATSLPHISYDIEVDLPQLSEDLVLCLENFSPFGAGSPEPLFLLRGIHVQQLQPVNGGHVRFLARQDGQTMPCIAFAFQQRVQDLQGEVDLLVAPQINRWNGRSELQLVVRDVRPHAGGVS